MKISIFEDTFTSITNPLFNSIIATSARVAESITPTATTLLLIYICFWSWSLARGSIKEPILDAVGRMVKLCFIYSIALFGVHYSTFVIEFFWRTPDAIAGIIISDQRMSTPNASMQFLDEFLRIYYEYSNTWMNSAQKKSYLGIPDITQLFIGFFLLSVGIINTAIAAFFLLLAKVALAIILGVGPIFIISLFFESTRKLFDAWIGQILNYLFIFALIAATMSIVGVEVFNKTHAAYIAACSSPNNCSLEPDFSSAIMIIILSAISIFFYFLIPGIASALGGGIALHTMGTVGWVYARADGLTRDVRRILTGQALHDRRVHRMQVTRARDWARNNPGMTRRTFNAAGRGLGKVFSRGNTIKKA